MISYNRLGVIHNPAQGTYKKVLCVCSAGILRSPTAAEVLHENFGYNTRAVGVDYDYALIPVTEALVAWADEIVCMESYHANCIKSEYGDHADKIMVLDIPDNFMYRNEELQTLILQKYTVQNE